MRMFCYGRASTDKQQITLLAQEEICRNYVALQHSMHPEVELAGWFPDAAVSATTPWFERPMGAKILFAIQPGDCIVVSNFDRAFRSVIDCDTCMRIAEERGFGLTILDVDVNTQTPLGRAFMKIIAVLKELEREEIGRRTREAHRLRKLQGKPVGVAPLGWKAGERTPDNKPGPLVPSVPERRLARRIVRMINENGLHVNEVRHILRVELSGIRRQGHTKPLSKWRARFNVQCLYMLAACNWPKIPQEDIPKFSEFLGYAALHDGRPPQLSVFGVSRGSVYNLPPVADPVPFFVPHTLTEYLQPWASAVVDPQTDPAPQPAQKKIIVARRKRRVRRRPKKPRRPSWWAFRARRRKTSPESKSPPSSPPSDNSPEPTASDDSCDTDGTH